MTINITTKRVLTTSPQHQACFVAGTLVHTDKGLVPIQDLKVGDMVLSRDENNPDGGVAYKRILRTFKSAEKEPIMAVTFEDNRLDSLSSKALSGIPSEYNEFNSVERRDYLNNISDPNSQFFRKDYAEFKIKVNDVLHYLKQKYNYETTFEQVYHLSYKRRFKMHVFCTYEHAFWTAEKGWTPIKEAPFLGSLKSFDDKSLSLAHFEPEDRARLYETSVTGIASYFHYDYEPSYTNYIEGTRDFVDFRTGYPVFTYGSLFRDSVLDYWFHSEHPTDYYHPLEASDPLPNDASDPAWNGLRDIEYNTGSKLHNPNRPDYMFDQFKAHVYNIEVEDFHTYFVGYAGLWVHNCNPNTIKYNP